MNLVAWVPDIRHGLNRSIGKDLRSVTKDRASSTVPATGEKQMDTGRAADVFVIFGITGDLAKVMTFDSLYRLRSAGF